MTNTTNTERGTCQVCGGTYKIVRGFISLHGYKRPGYGEIHGKCFGSRCLPFETDRAVLGEWIEKLTGWYTNAVTAKANAERELADETVTEVVHFPTYGGRPQKPVTYYRGVRVVME